MKEAVLFGEKSTASSMCRVYVVKIIRNSAIEKNMLIGRCPTQFPKPYGVGLFAVEQFPVGDVEASPWLTEKAAALEIVDGLRLEG